MHNGRQPVQRRLSPLLQAFNKPVTSADFAGSIAVPEKILTRRWPLSPSLPPAPAEEETQYGHDNGPGLRYRFHQKLPTEWTAIGRRPVLRSRPPWRRRTSLDYTMPVRQDLPSGSRVKFRTVLNASGDRYDLPWPPSLVQSRVETHLCLPFPVTPCIGHNLRRVPVRTIVPSATLCKAHVQDAYRHARVAGRRERPQAGAGAQRCRGTGMRGMLTLVGPESSSMSFNVTAIVLRRKAPKAFRRISDSSRTQSAGSAVTKENFDWSSLILMMLTTSSYNRRQRSEYVGPHREGC